MKTYHIAGAGKVMLVLLAVLVGLAGAQTPIYRSVQPGVTAAIGTGTGTLTISGSTATFSISQPDSVGVGDAIQYDSDSNGSIDAICFIHGRTSETEYTVKNAAGAEPTAVAGDEDWDIFRAYVDIEHVEGGAENTGINAAVRAFDGAARNLDSNGEIFNLAFYAGSESVVLLDWDSWDTSATEYLRLFAPHDLSEVGISQKNRYTITSGTIAFDYAASTDLTGHVRIDGLNFSSIGQAIEFEFSTSGGDYRVSNCNFYSNGTNLPSNSAFLFSGLSGAGNGGCTIRVWNCFISGFRSTDGGNDGYGVWMTGNLGNEPNVFFFNNTIVDCDKGIFNLYNAGLFRLINNVVMDCTDAWQFTSLHGDSDWNITDLNDPLWENNDIMSTELTFVDAENRNFHLTSSDAAVAIGTDLSGHASLPFSTDIDGDTRMTWNIGADEFQAEPSVSSGGDFFFRRRANR